MTGEFVSCRCGALIPSDPDSVRKHRCSVEPDPGEPAKWAIIVAPVAVALGLYMRGDHFAALLLFAIYALCGAIALVFHGAAESTRHLGASAPPYVRESDEDANRAAVDAEWRA